MRRAYHRGPMAGTTNYTYDNLSRLLSVLTNCPGVPSTEPCTHWTTRASRTKSTQFFIQANFKARISPKVPT